MSYPDSLKEKIKRIEQAEREISALLHEAIPDYHFLDYAVSYFWDCKKSPVGKCLFKLDDYGNKTFCRYCGGPQNGSRLEGFVMKEFAFDIKLCATVRVEAKTEQAARAILPKVIDCLDLTEVTIDGFNDGLRESGVQCVQLTEASLDVDDAGGPQLFEVDGEPID